jgi:hypothetical protein
MTTSPYTSQQRVTELLLYPYDTGMFLWETTSALADGFKAAVLQHQDDAFSLLIVTSTNKKIA